MAFLLFLPAQCEWLALLLVSFHCARLLSPICLHLFSLLLYCLTIRDQVELIKILLESHYYQAQLSPQDSLRQKDNPELKASLGRPA